MTLTPQEIEHIAALARLSLTDEEKAAFQRQLSSILDYVGQLQKVDTSGVEPMSHSVEVGNVLRADEVRACEEGTRKAMIDAFPEKDGALLKVKAVFGH
jgi:aspartyl-tRNA(Asn)/glutamyl-tRNA(Gln) amidotransferase subunit C